MRAGIGIGLFVAGGVALLLTALFAWPMVDAWLGVRAGQIDPILYARHHYEVLGFAVPRWGCWLIVGIGLLASLALILLGQQISSRERGG